MRWKIFQWMKFLFRHSSNSRKLSRQKFHNELACVFTAHYASKNADWNQQQLTDGGILANRNSANHPYCFLSNQKKVQILAFLHVICKRTVSCPPPESSLQRQRERAWSQANSKVTWYLQLRFVITSKTPDRLRRVYDASAKFRCQRLNDKMYREPDYLSSLFGVLLRFCELKEG